MELGVLKTKVGKETGAERQADPEQERQGAGAGPAPISLETPCMSWPLLHLHQEGPGWNFRLQGALAAHPRRLRPQLQNPLCRKAGWTPAQVGAQGQVNSGGGTAVC